MTTVANPTSQTEKPSNMPTWYETPRSLNQVTRLDSCSPPLSKSKRTSASIQKPISNSESSSAVGAIQTRGIGTTQSSSAPPSGSRISVVVIQPWLIETESPHFEPCPRGSPWNFC